MPLHMLPPTYALNGPSITQTAPYVGCFQALSAKKVPAMHHTFSGQSGSHCGKKNKNKKNNKKGRSRGAQNKLF